MSFQDILFTACGYSCLVVGFFFVWDFFFFSNAALKFRKD